MSTDDNGSEIKPELILDGLDEKNLDAIHDASMEILENTGIKIEHEEARRILCESGAEDCGDEVVAIPRSLVVDSIEKAPEGFTLHARNPDNDVEVGGEGCLKAPGYGAPNIRTYEDGRRASTLADYEVLVKLAHMEDVLNCTGYNLCEPNDVNDDVKYIEMMKKSLLYSDQPVLGPAMGEEHVEDCLEMVSIALGDHDLEKPYMAGLINPVPPLTLGDEMTGGLIAYARNEQPAAISNLTMAGASSPETFAGTLAQANAEILSCITIAQLVSSGAPVVYGLLSTGIDMRYGTLTIGSPEGALFVTLSDRLADYYGVPSRAGGSLTDSKLSDQQGGFESMMLLMAGRLSGIDFMPHSCGILESYSTISPEKFVLDCDLIRYVERFLNGCEVSDEAFALDVISRIGPGGNFLGDEHTRNNSNEFLIPEISDKQSHDTWRDAGSKDSLERGYERVQNLLEKYEKPELDGGRKEDIENYKS